MPVTILRSTRVGFLLVLVKYHSTRALIHLPLSRPLFHVPLFLFSAPLLSLWSTYASSFIFCTSRSFTCWSDTTIERAEGRPPAGVGASSSDCSAVRSIFKLFQCITSWIGWVLVCIVLQRRVWIRTVSLQRFNLHPRWRYLGGNGGRGGGRGGRGVIACVSAGMKRVLEYHNHNHANVQDGPTTYKRRV